MLFEEVVDPVGGRNLMEKLHHVYVCVCVREASGSPKFYRPSLFLPVLCFLLHQNERALRRSSSVFRDGSSYSCYHTSPV